MSVKVLETLSIGKTELVAQIVTVPPWIDPFISYLRDRILPIQAARYLFKNGILYRHGISTAILRCL